MLRWIIVVVASVLGCSKGVSTRPASLVDQEVTVMGENYCLGCALARRAGAASQCDVYGHRHTLKVETALGVNGKPIGELAGETLHYLDNDQSAAPRGQR